MKRIPKLQWVVWAASLLPILLTAAFMPLCPSKSPCIGISAVRSAMNPNGICF